MSNSLPRLELDPELKKRLEELAEKIKELQRKAEELRKLLATRREAGK